MNVIKNCKITIPVEYEIDQLMDSLDMENTDRLRIVDAFANAGER